MINLLPPEHALRIRFGRRNSVLRRWIFGAGVAIGGLVLILAGGWIYINSQYASLQNQLSQTEAQLQAQNLPKVQSDATTISGDIKVIDRILSSEVDFSKLIQDIGKLMPSGAVLESLTLTKVNGAVDLSVSAKDYGSATQVAVNLDDPSNGIFSKVDIVNINCAGSGTYPCSGTFKALFSSSAQKKYQNVPQGGQ